MAQGGGPQLTLLNIIVELKKCCNHPFLFATAEADYRGKEGDQNAVDRLVHTSGKMVLLDKLLRSLKQDGHRCAFPPCLAPFNLQMLSENSLIVSRLNEILQTYDSVLTD